MPLDRMRPLRMLLRRGLGLPCSLLSDSKDGFPVLATHRHPLAEPVPAKAGTGVHDGARAVNRVVAVAKAHFKVCSTNERLLNPCWLFSAIC